MRPQGVDTLIDDLLRVAPVLQRPNEPAQIRRPEHDHPIAVRAHAEPPGWKPHPASPLVPKPTVEMLIHTVPLPEPGERLWFTIFGYLTNNSHELHDVGLFLGDNVSSDRAAAIRSEAAAAGIEVSDRNRFLDRLYRTCYQRRVPLVGWAVHLDLFRIAAHFAIARKGVSRGGYSLIMFTKPDTPTAKRPLLTNGEVEDGNRPRIVIRMLDATRGIIRWATPGRPDPDERGGHRPIVSLQPITETLTGQTLATITLATRALGLEPPTTSREDGPVASAVADILALVDVHRRTTRLHHAITPMAPLKTTSSPGTYAAALLDQTGLKPRFELQPDLDRQNIATWMAATYGGDCFPAIRHPSLPVVTLDFAGLYPAIGVLSSTWDLYAASRIETRSRNPKDTAAYVYHLARRIRGWANNPQRPFPISRRDWRHLTRTVVPRPRIRRAAPHTDGGTASNGLRPCSSVHSLRHRRCHGS